MVLVPFTVTDHNGKTIEGLRAQNFTVLDDHVPQPIASFTMEDAPCSVGVVLDMSGSMRNALATATKVAHAFFRTANPEDEFLMLSVSTRPDAMPEFTADTGALERTIQSARPGGLTALFDAVGLGLQRMKQAKRQRRALLILSDGIDNHSRSSKRELMRAALEADVQVYSIIMDGLEGGSGSNVPFRPIGAQKPWEQSAARQGPQTLEELSDKTGGLHLHVRNAAEAVEAATKVGRALRNEYVIAYRPAPSATAGKWHQVRVKSNIPDANVSGRGGYYSQQ